jgi:hypothetical protein
MTHWAAGGVARRRLALDLSRALALPVSPVPRRIERSAPNAIARHMGRILVSDIGCRVMAIGQRPAVAHHPGVQILARGRTNSDDTAILVHVMWNTVDRLASDPIRQGERRLLATSVLIAARLAKLIMFRRIDAKQTDALPVDLDCVAVDDRGLPDSIGRGGSRGEREHCKR